VLTRKRSSSTPVAICIEFLVLLLLLRGWIDRQPSPYLQQQLWQKCLVESFTFANNFRTHKTRNSRKGESLAKKRFLTKNPGSINRRSCSSTTRQGSAATSPPSMPGAKTPSNVKLLILPGFGNDASDYRWTLPAEPSSDLNIRVGSLVDSLVACGWLDEQIQVLPVQRLDWLQVFVNGLFDETFWLGTTNPTRPSFRWYLQAIAQSVRDISSDDTYVVLICHSAGGWLARAALGYFGNTTVSNESDNATLIPLHRVLGLVTLGSPHLPPPPDIMDMTRGALKITNAKFPGAYYKDATSPENSLFYITVMGNAIQGKQHEDDEYEVKPPPSENLEKDDTSEPLSWIQQVRQRVSSLPPMLPRRRRRTAAEFAYSSYQAVCGQGDAVGDGVVPLSHGHLNSTSAGNSGSIQLTLDNVFHSINVPSSWYGSSTIISSWHGEMMREIQRALVGKMEKANVVHR
jgi:pimeloyl-ACP methyl ester carboxylesterase